jgi:hypothetical protein
MRSIALVFFVLASPIASAITVSSVTGASNSTTSGTPIVYGGMAGPDTCGTETCNNCSGSLTMCNEARISNNVVVSIATSNAETNLELIVTDRDNNPVIMEASSRYSHADLKWSTICNTAFTNNSTDCATITDTSGNLRIWLDKNDNGAVDEGTDEYVSVTFRVIVPTVNFDVYGVAFSEGIGNFFPYPGDEKVYMEQLNTPESFPVFTYGSRATSIRVFVAEGNMLKAMPTIAHSTVDLDLDDEGTAPLKDIVSGLTNGTTYTFRIAMLDEALNVVQFFPNTAVAAVTDCEVDTVDKNICAYAAIPDEVVGLLNDDFNCFIASAAYGSSLEPKLAVFRQFRKHILLTRAWGKNFVTWYYKNGPFAARYIHDKPLLRAVTRAALWPLYGFSVLALKLGLLPSLLITLTLITFMIALPWFGVRRRASRG